MIKPKQKLTAQYLLSLLIAVDAGVSGRRGHYAVVRVRSHRVLRGAV